MSSSSNQDRKHGQQQQPVVQTILESFTRCFNPIDVGCSKINNNSNSNGAYQQQRQSSSSSPYSQLFGLNIGNNNNGNGNGGGGGGACGAVSRSTSSNEMKDTTTMTYDAQGIAKAKKSAHYANSLRKMSAEALAERSLKRKLEIFRAPSGRDTSPQQRRGSSPTSSRRQPSPATPNNDNIATATPSQTEQLKLSDDEEELIRLTQSRKRFACGVNFPEARPGSPLLSLGSLFQQAQKPFGLCFATPVRTASPEDIHKLSDDKLTDDEYALRHPLTGGGEGGQSAAQVSPETQGDHQSYNEEETITSTLYFDQKYSHVVQTRPPMPLFQENMLSCTESKADELTNILSQRSTTNPPPEFVGKLSSSTPPRKYGGGSPFRRGSPFRTSSPKIGRGSGGSPARRSPKTIFTSSTSTKKVKNVGKKVDVDEYLFPPSPIKIRDDSLSMNTSAEDESLGMEEGIGEF